MKTKFSRCAPKVLVKRKFCLKLCLVHRSSLFPRIAPVQPSTQIPTGKFPPALTPVLLSGVCACSRRRRSCGAGSLHMPVGEKQMEPGLAKKKCRRHDECAVSRCCGVGVGRGDGTCSRHTAVCVQVVLHRLSVARRGVWGQGGDDRSFFFSSHGIGLRLGTWMKKKAVLRSSADGDGARAQGGSRRRGVWCAYNSGTRVTLRGSPCVPVACVHTRNCGV